MRASPQNKTQLAWLALLILVAFTLRAYRLDFQNLRGDESFALIFAERSLGEILHDTRQWEPHPPLYYLLLHYWVALVGDSEFSLRYPSLFFGLLAIPLLYTLARLLFGESLAFLTALLLVGNPFHIFWNQDARMYAMTASLSLASVLLFVMALQRGGKGSWSGYLLATLLSLYTHYSSLFILAAEDLFLLAFWRSYRLQIRPWLFAQVGLALLFLPWLALAGGVLTTYHGNAESLDLPSFLQRLLLTFSLGGALDRERAWPYLFGFGALLLLGIYHRWRQGRWLTLLGLYLGLPSLFLSLASLRRPVFSEAYIIAVSFPYYILLASGLLMVSQLAPWGKARAPTLVVLLGLSLMGQAGALGNYFFDPRYAKSPDWRAWARYIAEEGRPGDLIIENYPDPSFGYYYRGEFTRRLLPASTNVKREATEAELSRAAQEYKRFWLVHAGGSSWDEGMVVETWLDRHQYRLDNRGFPTERLALYLSLPALEKQGNFLEPTQLNFGDQIELMGYRIGGEFPASASRQVAPGETLSLLLLWRAKRVPPQSYTVFVHLLDAGGRLWAQQDNPPVGGTYPTYEWQEGEMVTDRYRLSVKPETPPGEYRLEIGLYRLETMERLSLLSPEGKPLGTSASLGNIRVMPR